jgi:signal transduction histidine kinase
VAAARLSCRAALLTWIKSANGEARKLTASPIRGIALEQQPFTSEFWEALGAVDILFLILAGFIGWKLRSIADRGQVDARDERLKLAREKQQDLAQKLAVVTTESLELQHQLALHDKGFTELTALQSAVRSTIAAIRRVNDSSDVLATTLSPQG